MNRETMTPSEWKTEQVRLMRPWKVLLYTTALFVLAEAAAVIAVIQVLQ